MTKPKLKISIISLMMLGMLAPACYAHPAFMVQAGLKALEDGDLEKAESSLQNARFEEPDSYEINYNLGIVAYRKRDYSKSVKLFARASELAKNQEERFNTFYNMGNAAFKGYDYQLAITAYKNALTVKNDYQADYNLKVAEKKLQEMLDRMKKEQEKQNQDNQQQNGQKDQQNQQQNGQQGQQDQQNQQQNGQQGQQDQQNQQQNGQQGQQDQQNQQQDGQQSEKNDDERKSSDNNQNNASDKENANSNEEDKNSSAENEKNKNNTNDSDKANNNMNEQVTNDKTASASAPINETSANPEEDRRDVKMTEDKGKVGRPEASQKARAMKNIKLNKEEVEAYLKEMEESEAEAQKYYRINNILEKDPAYMNQDELREWMKVRNRKKARESRNEQDW